MVNLWWDCSDFVVNGWSYFGVEKYARDSGFIFWVFPFWEWVLAGGRFTAVEVERFALGANAHLRRSAPKMGHPSFKCGPHAHPTSDVGHPSTRFQMWPPAPASIREANLKSRKAAQIALVLHWLPVSSLKHLDSISRMKRVRNDRIQVRPAVTT
jgi:hypothetical protein